ncbi:MAG TPA: 3'(2'),5'-bisphosphate nucleotidase CysQ [Pyrinomonadaceae bacterium]|nr:3'(2'),5'-bisphosphate nucleotidase CysQ [Pyrinomonadaceae bacterium]
MFESELETACRLARDAGKLILEHYAREIIAEEKLGVDNFYEPVTIADREASEIIVSSLAASFPNDAILSEEEKDDASHRLSKSRTWIIDPIDGTAGFVRKDGDFGVQIGLIEEGQPVLGVVHLPYLEKTYFAALGLGSFCQENGNKSRLNVSGKTDFTEMNLAVTKNHPSERMQRILEEFAFKTQVKRGSVGLKIGLIAERICDIYIHPSPRTKLWDTCAPQIILEEAGGLMSDLFGFPLIYDAEDLQNHNGILATNRASHDEAVEKLKGLMNEFGRLRVIPKQRAQGN